MVQNSSSNIDNQQQSSVLCLVDHLIKDLEYLWQDHQTADVIFLLDSLDYCSTGTESGQQTQPSKATTAEPKALYAHRLILRTRCQSFRNISTDSSNNNSVCHRMYGSTISHDGNAWVIRWPNIKPNVLNKVLRYVYTSKLELPIGNKFDGDDNDDDLFELLAISYELGLDELIAIGEERIATSINVHNACHFLNQTIKIGSKINHNESYRRLIQLSMQFIGQAASDCVKTESFLKISKETMIHLLSSDQFALQEADVFRCALQWARHQTGNHKPIEHWTEEDRKRMKNQLSGVINHIRILLIDSQVFAKEVEPTGVVPIELSLERYRFAALTLNNNNKPSINDQTTIMNNKRLQPRNYMMNRYFLESKLLFNNVKLENILNEWYECMYQIPNQIPKQNSPPTWKLIYRASEHEFSAEAFHNHCDGIKPTYILAMSTKGYLSGGFSDVAWSRGNKGRGCYVPSEQAFLFRLQSPQCDQQQPIKYDVKKKMFAIGHMATKGPVFGAGADFLLADSCHLNEDSYSNLPHSYDGLDANPDALFGSYYFTVLDYEVFTLNPTN